MCKQFLPIITDQHVFLGSIFDPASESEKFQEQYKYAGHSMKILLTILKNKKWTREKYEKMGILIVNETNDLQYEAIMPENWTVQPAGNYWIHVYDDKYRLRFSIYKKDEDYDRDYFVRFKTRIHIEKIAENDNSVYIADSKQLKSFRYAAMSYEGKILFASDVAHIDNIDTTEDPNDIQYTIEKSEKISQQECVTWLQKNYPYWSDVNAYWSTNL